jgi:type IV pilus assembly protein PilC
MYQYKAYSPEKKLVEGTINASSENMAEEFLHKAGFTDVLTLKEQTPRQSILNRLHLGRGVSKADIVEFFQQLATLIDSRMPVVQAISLLADQTPKAELKGLITKLGERLSAGLSLSQALSWFPQYIPAHYREVIRVSEQSGNLGLGLRLVAGYMEKENAVSKNLTRTLGYPVFLIGMSAIVIAVVAVVAIPSLSNLFTTLDVTLPLPTRMLIALTHFISHYYFYLIPGLAALVLAIYYLVKSPAGKQWLDRTTLRLPVMGPVIVLRNICRFCRNTSMLQEAGLTLPQSLNTVLGVIDNSVIKAALSDIRQDLIKGKGLSLPMSGNEVFPRLLVDMVYIGEKTGTLQTSFATMADFYEKKLDQKVQRLLAMVEPASIIIVGLIIAFIGSSIIMPIYTMYRGLHM